MSNQASLSDSSGDSESERQEGSNEGLERRTVCGFPPKDWKSKRLENITRIVSGKSLPTEEQGESEGFPVYKVEDMNKSENFKYMNLADNYLTKEKIDELNHSLHPENTVILPKVGAALLTNKRRILTEKASFDNNTMGWIPGEKLNPEFFYYTTCRVDMESYAQKGAVPSISKSIAGNLKFPVPEKDEQRRIASVLCNVDQAISKTEELIEQTQRVKKGLMQDLVFEAEDEGSEERRFGPKLFQVDPSWEKVRLKEVAEVITRGKQPEYADKGVPVINQECIYWDGFYSENTKILDEEAAEDWKDKYFAKPQDVLINSTGKGTLGRATVFSEDEQIAIDSHVTRVQPDQDRLDPRFFRYFLEHNQGQGLLYSMCVSGSTGQIELSKTKLKLFTFPLPSLEEQKEISEKLEIIDEKINKNQEYKDQLQRLKKGLMQDLLTGKVRTSEDVPVLDEVVEVERE